jgi:polyisoprenoid-binding protein YceI
MRYVVDVANSEINWTGFQPGTSLSGRVFLSNGFVEMDQNREITTGAITIDMNSIEALDDQLKDDEKRKLSSHLRSGDFFDTAIYPTAQLNILEVKAIGDRADSCNLEGMIHPTHEVTGELTIKGIKQNISALVNMQISGKKLVVQTMFTLDRLQWGIDHMSERSFGSKRVLPDMEIMMKVVADASQQSMSSGSAVL